jgi:hypothetical protein
MKSPRKAAGAIDPATGEPKVKAKADARPKVSKKELITTVVQATGVKRGDAMKVIDATLQALNDALDGGKDVAATPFGMLRVVKKKEGKGGGALVCRVRLAKPNEKAASEDLAEAAD